MSELDKLTLLLQVGTDAVQFWSLNFVIQLSLRDSIGYGMCGNEIKPQTLASLGIYNSYLFEAKMLVHVL